MVVIFMVVIFMVVIFMVVYFVDYNPNTMVVMVFSSIEVMKDSFQESSSEPWSKHGFCGKLKPLKQWWYDDPKETGLYNISFFMYINHHKSSIE